MIQLVRGLLLACSLLGLPWCAGGLRTDGMALEMNDCQSFFLLDGRDDIDLPDTWGAARDNFASVCEHFGVPDGMCAKASTEVFQAKADDEVWQEGEGSALCAKLVELSEQALESSALKLRAKPKQHNTDDNASDALLDAASLGKGGGRRRSFAPNYVVLHRRRG